MMPYIFALFYHQNPYSLVSHQIPSITLLVYEAASIVLISAYALSSPQQEASEQVGNMGFLVGNMKCVANAYFCCIKVKWPAQKTHHVTLVAVTSCWVLLSHIRYCYVTLGH